MTEISIKAEELGEIGGFKITNSLLTSFIVLALLTSLAWFYSKESQKKKKGRLFYLATIIQKQLYKLFKGIFGEKTSTFYPLLSAFFIFILIQNWFGLLPGVGSILFNHHPLLRGANADLNTTLALALISFGSIQYFGIRSLGIFGYLKKFINLSNPINFFTGILEIVSEFSKILSFSFRLFGNIFAGEVLLAIIAFLVPVAVSFPFLLLEIFVGFIQALVFTMLSAVFLSLAISKHH